MIGACDARVRTGNGGDFVDDAAVENILITSRSGQLDQGEAKAAAGATRIRLRSATNFSSYDRQQLVEHEAFVHSLTALNGREQPHLKSLARSSPRTTTSHQRPRAS